MTYSIKVCIVHTAHHVSEGQGTHI